jgi:anti-sigma B factor antagonist
MDSEVKKDENILIFTPSYAHLDAMVATSFKSKFVDLINSGAKQFILNLSNVSFIDSSGLGAIIRTLTLLEKNQGSLFFCNVSDPVLMVFKIAHLDQLIQILPSEKDSIEHYKSDKRAKQ